MGSLSFGEILTILVVVLVIFGPQGLPELARKLGALMAKVREATRSLTSQLEREYGEGMEPIRELKSQYDATKRDLTDAVTAIGGDARPDRENSEEAQPEGEERQ